MAHSGHHEELDGIRGLVLSDGLHDLVVVHDAIQWIDLLIGPPVIHQQFAAAIEERFQIRVSREERTVVGFAGAVDIGRDVHLVIVPISILEDDIPHATHGKTEWLRPAKSRPAQFRSWHQVTVKNGFPGLRILQRGCHYFRRFDLALR